MFVTSGKNDGHKSLCTLSLLNQEVQCCLHVLIYVYSRPDGGDQTTPLDSWANKGTF